MDQPQAAGQASHPHNPYAMPAAPVYAPPALAGPLASASRWSRLGASLVDTLLVYVTFVPLLVAVVAGQNSAGAAFLPLIVLTPVLMLALLAANLVMLDRSAQSLGKRLLGIRILRSDGTRPTLGRSFGIRAMVPFAINMVFGLFGLVDVLWIFGPERRCLHDLMADTIVVPVE